MDSLCSRLTKHDCLSFNVWMWDKHGQSIVSGSNQLKTVGVHDWWGGGNLWTVYV